MEVHQVYSKDVKDSQLYFRQHSPNFGHFPKIYFNDKYHRLSIETSSYR